VGLSNARRVLTIFGAVYVVIGVLGFVPFLVVPMDGPLPGTGLLLGVFAVNPLHNVAHLLLGAAMIYGGGADARFWPIGRALTGVFAVLVVGSVVAPIAEGVAINPADTGLHLISAVLLAFLAFRTQPSAGGVSQTA
jgi:hypothetical protein